MWNSQSSQQYTQENISFSTKSMATQNPISYINDHKTEQRGKNKKRRSKHATTALAKYTSYQRTLFQDENFQLELFSRFPRQIKTYLRETGIYTKYKEGEEEIYGGISEIGIAWIFVRGRIFVWNCNYSKREAEFCKCLDAPAIITETNQRYLVAAVYSGKTSFGIVFVTPEGILRYWPDFMREQYYTDHQVELDDGEYLSAIGHGMPGIVLLGSSNGRLWRCCCRPSEIEVSTMTRSSGILSFFWSSSSSSSNQPKHGNAIRRITMSEEGEAFILTTESIQKWNITSSSASFDFEWNIFDLVSKQINDNADDQQQVYNLSIEYNGVHLLLLTASHPTSVGASDVPLLSYTVWELDPLSRGIENMYPLPYQPDYEVDYANELLWNSNIYSQGKHAFYVAWSFGFVAAHAPLHTMMSFIPGQLMGHGMTSTKFFGLNIRDGLLICNDVEEEQPPPVLDRQHREEEEEEEEGVVDSFVTAASTPYKEDQVPSSSSSLSSSLYPSLFDETPATRPRSSKEAQKPSKRSSAGSTSPPAARFSEMSPQDRILKAFAMYSSDTRDLRYRELLQGDFDLSTAVVMASQYLVDHQSSSVLHWESKTSSSQTLSQLSLLILNLLQQKVSEHDRYLKFLSISGILKRLPTSATTNVLEHGEKLCAAVGLRKHQNQQQEQGNENERQKTIEFFSDAIHRCGKARGERSEYFTAQHFYSNISRIQEILPQLIQIEDESLADTDFQEHRFFNTNKQSRIIWSVNEIFRVFAENVSDYRDSHINMYRSSSPSTPWTTSIEILKHFHYQFKETENLLRTSDDDNTSYSNNSINNNNDHHEYKPHQRRHHVLPLELPLFDQLFVIVDFILHALSAVDETTATSHKRQEQLHRHRHEYISLFIDRQQYGYAKILGERYHDFNNLIVIAEKENDRQRLDEYLEKFQEFNFANILFNYFYQKRQFSRLLGIHPKFYPWLTAFLRDMKQPELEWMHAVTVKDYATATDRLFSLAQHNNKSVTGRKTHLSLAKLCNVAKERLSPPMDQKQQNDIQNHLYLVHAQECLPGFGIELQDPETPLPPEDLIALYCDFHHGTVDTMAMAERVIAALEIWTWSRAAMPSEEHQQELRDKIWLSAWRANAAVDVLTPTWDDIVSDRSGDVSVKTKIEETVIFQSGVQYTGEAALDAEVFDRITTQENVDVRLKNAVWTLLEEERHREQQEQEQEQEQNDINNIPEYNMNSIMKNAQEANLRQYRYQQEQEQEQEYPSLYDNNNLNNNDNHENRMMMMNMNGVNYDMNDIKEMNNIVMSNDQIYNASNNNNNNNNNTPNNDIDVDVDNNNNGDAEIIDFGDDEEENDEHTDDEEEEDQDEDDELVEMMI